MSALRIVKETKQIAFLAGSFAIILAAGVACTLVIPEPTGQPIVVTPVAYQSQTPVQAPISTSAQPTANTSPTPTPTPWPTATPDASISLATPTLSSTATPVETPTPRPTRIPTLRPAPTTEPTPSVMTGERAKFMAARGLSLSQKNLEGADLSNHSWGGINFSFANLREADFRGAILVRANLRHADLTGADLTGADLTGADFTGADLTGASFRDLSQLNWIDRELVLTGQLPPIPDWLFPPIAEESFVEKTEKGDRVAQGQEMLRWSGADWCRLTPTRKLMLRDYAVWLGDNIDDWLVRGARDRCPL